jgi:hypothetical protein
LDPRQQSLREFFPPRLVLQCDLGLSQAFSDNCIILVGSTAAIMMQ